VHCSDFCDAYLTHDSVRSALASLEQALARWHAPCCSPPCASSTTRASSTRRVATCHA